VTYTTRGNLAALTPGLQLTVYRIAQEALTNALRHAGTDTTVQVTLRADPRAGQVRIAVEDTGPPAGHPAQAGGSPGQPGGLRAQADGEHEAQGLAGIRERASLLGGTAQAGPRGGGWAVHAVLPVPPTLAVLPVSPDPPDPPDPAVPTARADWERP
jgi:signal transduction histidine kinase